MIWFTSDCHFNHNNILEFEPETRPFSSIEDMNEAIISNWNAVVSDDDEVYVLGDFFMGKVEDIPAILTRLKGHIHLVRGNHDHKKRIAIYQEYGIDCVDFRLLPYKGLVFALCHYPPVSEEYKDMVDEGRRNTYFLYGHVHSKAPKGLHNWSYHVGVDTNNLTPVSLKQIISEIKGEQ